MDYRRASRLRPLPMPELNHTSGPIPITTIATLIINEAVIKFGSRDASARNQFPGSN